MTTPTTSKQTGSQCLYRGGWGADGRIAYVEERGELRPLEMSWQTACSLEWGTNSVGTSRLAAAILDDLPTNNVPPDRAREQLTVLLARLPQRGFVLSDEEIRAWLFNPNDAPTREV